MNYMKKYNRIMDQNKTMYELYKKIIDQKETTKAPMQICKELIETINELERQIEYINYRTLQKTNSKENPKEIKNPEKFTLKEKVKVIYEQYTVWQKEDDSEPPEEPEK